VSGCGGGRRRAIRLCAGFAAVAGFALAAAGFATRFRSIGRACSGAIERAAPADDAGADAGAETAAAFPSPPPPARETRSSGDGGSVAVRRPLKQEIATACNASEAVKASAERRTKPVRNPRSPFFAPSRRIRSRTAAAAGDPIELAPPQPPPRGSLRRTARAVRSPGRFSRAGLLARGTFSRTPFPFPHSEQWLRVRPSPSQLRGSGGISPLFPLHPRAGNPALTVRLLARRAPTSQERQGRRQSAVGSQPAELAAADSTARRSAARSFV
jgi:hypothetical protein